MRRLATALLVGLAAVSALAQDGVTVEAALDSRDVLLGDAVGYRIVVVGSDRAEGPEPEEFGDAFDARFVGAQPMHSSRRVIMNGEIVREDEVRVTLEYALHPRRAGRLTVPAMDVDVAGATLRTEALPVHVVGPSPSRFASVELSVEPPQVYAEQPVELVLRAVLQRAQHGEDWYEGDPWLGDRPPELRVPWFRELSGFTTGDFQAFVDSLRAGRREGGFRVNGLAERSVWGEARAVRFRLKRSTRHESGRVFHEYVVRKRFVPLEPGTIELPVSSLAGDLVTSVREVGGRLQPGATESVFVAHEPISLEVLPVPTEGRPPTYSHAVGQFQVKGEISPTRVKVGDPITLRVQIAGLGLVERITAPRLNQQQDLVADFAVAGAGTARVEREIKVFEFTLRPRRAGIAEVPPIQVAMFDPSAGEFVVRTTEAFPIEVEEALAVGTSEIVGVGPLTSRTSSPGEEVRGGLLGNYGVIETLRDEGFRPFAGVWAWLALLGPPFVLVGAAVVAWRRRRLDADPALRRAKAAFASALASVERARERLTSGDASGAAAALHGALAGYVADRAGVPAGGLTAADVERRIGGRGVPAAAEVVAMLEACEAWRYGGEAAAIGELLDAAPGWLRALEAERL